MATKLTRKQMARRDAMDARSEAQAMEWLPATHIVIVTENVVLNGTVRRRECRPVIRTTGARYPYRSWSAPSGVAVTTYGSMEDAAAYAALCQSRDDDGLEAVYEAVDLAEAARRLAP